MTQETGTLQSLSVRIAGNLPIVPEVGVLALVPDDWWSSWQTRHHVLTHLSRFYTVVWSNPAPEWREAVQERRRTKNLETRPAAWPGFKIYVPDFWLPKLYRPRVLGDLFFQQRVGRARQLLERQGCTKFILYLWRPEFSSALGYAKFDFSCYHIDDEYSFSDVRKPENQSELKLIASVDHVFVHSPALLERKGQINPRTTFVPNGVDYETFARRAPEPPDLHQIPRPRIGYIGYLKRMLDWELLSRLAAEHQGWSFIFVGPTKKDADVASAIDALKKQPNVYFLGSKQMKEIAAYPQHFDVCILPYRATDYTNDIYPLKLHEYLASGQPAVGSRIRSLEEFADLVFLATTPEEWAAAIQKALSPEANAPRWRTARQAVARRHDWGAMVEQIATAMAEGVDVNLHERVAIWRAHSGAAKG